MNKKIENALLSIGTLVFGVLLILLLISIFTYDGRAARALAERPEGDGPFVFDRVSLRWHDLTPEGRLWRDCVTLDNGYLYYAEWDDPLVPLSEFQGHWEKDGICIVVSGPVWHSYAVAVVDLSGNG